MKDPIRIMKPFLLAAVLVLFIILSAAEIRVVAQSTPGRPLASVNERWIRKELEEKSDVTIMLFGTNDVCNSKVLSTPESYRKTLNMVIKLVRESQSKLVLVTIPPCNEKNLYLRHKKEVFGNLSPNQRILQFNGILKETAEAKKLPLADFYTVVMKSGCEGKSSLLRIPETSGVPDGIQLTDAGYAVLAKRVGVTIQSVDYAPKTVLGIGDSLTYGVGSRDAGKVSGSIYPAQLKKALNQMLVEEKNRVSLVAFPNGKNRLKNG